MRSACAGFIWQYISGLLGSLLQGITEEAFGGVTCMFLLSSRAEVLEREMTDLTGKEEDLSHQIKHGRHEKKTSTEEAKIWRDQVRKVGADAKIFLNDFQRREGFSLQSSYQFGCHVDRLLKAVRRLMAESTGLTVLAPAPPDPVVHLQGSSRVIGVEIIWGQICGLVEDEDSRIIGIHGMGGVGKTTLLKEINNYFFDKRSRRFDLVISVTVSNMVDIDGIQKQILDRLGYSDRDEKRKLPQDRDGRKTTLCRDLCETNFLLLLDDLWKELDLPDVGISLANRGSKIVFTTRLAEVCTKMEADQKVRVHCLNQESSWKLFCQVVGENIDKLDASTKSLAKQVAGKCGGLPLALVTVGKAMAEALTDCEWEAALETLKGAAAEFREIEDFRTILKFSFDRLKDEGHQDCLLYCSLFPEDCVMNVDQLIEFWVGEGFLETSSSSMRTARTRGQRAITALKAACLLEDGHETKISKKSVKLHDMIREMALWIPDGDCEADKKKIVVVDPSKGLELAQMERWTRAERISLMSNRIRKLQDWPQWQNLRTLLLSGSTLPQIPTTFFMSMPLLTVLDLSGTNLEHLPKEICWLVELRYLSLKGTSLKLLPEELGRLRKLRILNLDELERLTRIPKEAISSLAGLQSLIMNAGVYKWRGGWKDNIGEDQGRQIYLKDLDGLEQLEELQLTIRVEFNEDWDGLLLSQKLPSVIRSMRLTNLESCLSPRKQLHFSSLFPCLEEVWVYSCPELEKLPFELNSATGLQILDLNECTKMVEIIAIEESKITNSHPPKDSFFPRLRKIRLKNLQNLKRMCRKPLMFPCLEEVWVDNCPELEKLPFEFDSATSLQILSLSKCTKMMEIIAVKESEITNAHPQKDSCFPRLRKLSLTNMQNLRRICRRPVLFPCLEKVSVYNCPELEKLSFELNSATSLQILHLSECTKMVEIIAVEELEITNEDPPKDSFFPRLREIRLTNMQNLKSICRNPLLLPCLEEVWMCNCPNLEKLPFELNSATCLQILDLNKCTKLVEIIAVEEPKITNEDPPKDSFFPRLREIRLTNMQNLKSKCRKPLLFPCLEKVCVENCPQLETLPFELNSAIGLKILVVNDCNKMVEIIAVEESKISNAQPPKDSSFPRLRKISLTNLHNLKSICKKPLMFPCLEEVRVDNCPELEKLPFELYSVTGLRILRLSKCTKMTEVIAVKELEITNAHPPKDSCFPRLRKIWLTNMKNLKSICKKPLLFPCLTSLWVEYCPQLEKLPFELSGATSLQILHLNECTKMVEIIAVEESDITNVDLAKDPFFPRLREIRLKNMQNLKRICRKPLVFPCLEEVWLYNCSELEKLPFELYSATTLQILCLSKCSKMVEIIEVEESDITSVDPPNDSSFPKLRRISLISMKNLKIVCKKPLLFPCLEEVRVDNCPELEKVPFEFYSATGLQILHLNECTKIMEIIAIEESEITNAHPPKDSFFLRLREIRLTNMQNLKSISMKPLSFPCLHEVCVDNCPNLEKLPFELNSAICLKILVVNDCNKLVEIISAEESKITNTDPPNDSSFPKLRCISLTNMNNLKSICMKPLLFPCLEKVSVYNCPKLEKIPFELNSATDL